ncbi:MAG: hypothetical protein WBF90_08405 [Rivularia sp. (in: cyanobacteria)]
MSWLLAYNRKLQQALYWLHGRQYRKMRYEGEAIRERILQDLFIFRRSLELSQVKNRESQKESEKYDLKTFENIHHSLKELSEYLYPAHVDDSLSLAIECLLESWRSDIPHLNLQINVPSQERYKESYEFNRIILMVLSELFQITLPLISDEVSIFISLDWQRYRNKLIVKLNLPSIFKLKSDSCLQKLDFIKNIFRFLTSGKCFYRQESSSQTWYFYWHSPKQAVTEDTSNEIQTESFVKLIN